MRPVTDQHARSPWRARLWALLEAFGAASAMIDPSGLASAQRLRALQERRRASEAALQATRASSTPVSVDDLEARRAGSTPVPAAGQAGRQRGREPVSPALAR